MNRIFIILFVFTSLNSKAQDSLVQARGEKTNIEKYSAIERRQFYPFSHASKVKIVSFTWAKDPSGHYEYRLPTMNDTVCENKLEQIITLSQTDLDTLSDLLYNTCGKWKVVDESRALCFLPRNAIIFYNEKNISFAYIEICFECSGTWNSQKSIKEFETCRFFYEDVQHFFSQRGLKTSAIELIDANSDKQRNGNN